jgi:hypothetical protein
MLLSKKLATMFNAIAVKEVLDLNFFTELTTGLLRRTAKYSGFKAWLARENLPWLALCARH